MHLIRAFLPIYLCFWWRLPARVHVIPKIWKFICLITHPRPTVSWLGLKDLSSSPRPLVAWSLEPPRSQTSDLWVVQRQSFSWSYCDRICALGSTEPWIRVSNCWRGKSHLSVYMRLFSSLDPRSSQAFCLDWCSPTPPSYHRVLPMFLKPSKYLVVSFVGQPSLINIFGAIRWMNDGEVTC